MPFSADPLSLTTRIGQIVVISTPHEHAPIKFDWGRWVTNTAMRFNQFTSPAPRRIFLLDKADGQGERSAGVGLAYARQNIQTADMLGLLGSWTESTLVLAFGSWSYTLSSWVESLRTIAHATHSEHVSRVFDAQLDLWRQLENRHSDDTLFVLSDSGSRVANASEHCRGWLRRIVRSRISQEPQHGAWSCSIMSILADDVSDTGRSRIHRLITLDPTIWCGDPNWHEVLPTFLLDQIASCEEVWVSVPTSVLIQEIFAKIGAVVSKKSKLSAPSVVLGWHPVRDFILFLGSKSSKRLFVFMDSQERLQIMMAESVEDPSNA